MKRYMIQFTQVNCFGKNFVIVTVEFLKIWEKYFLSADTVSSNESGKNEQDSGYNHYFYKDNILFICYYIEVK